MPPKPVRAAGSPILTPFVRLAILAATISTAAAAPSFTQILGQPTDHSITVSVRSDTAVELYFEFGVATAVYKAQTPAATPAADPFAKGFYVAQVVLPGLAPDTQYFYRMQSRAAGSADPFVPGTENSFHTQRQPGSSFVFCIQGDSHPERANNMFNSALYQQTLTAVAAEHPDFYLTSGDDFSVDTLQPPYTSANVTGRYTLQLPYFDILGRNSALFLTNGNHEEASLANLNLPPDANNSNQVPIWAQNARNTYYAQPAPTDAATGTFYTGNTTNVPGIGILRDYYSWQWGDALFAVIDPYWTSPAQVDTGLGGNNDAASPKTGDLWQVTHGDAQYLWLKQTLEQSKAKWKFVFAHHVLGTQRGGVEVAPDFEWGGSSKNGANDFAKQRPTWTAPIHKLFVDNHVTIFFQAHDHIFVHQQLDGVTYQSLPNPADNTYTAFNSTAYKTGEQFPNAGYTRITVGPADVKVDYIREFLPKDEKPPKLVSGMNQFSYTITSPKITRVANAASESTAGIAPNSWVEINGTGLAPAGDSRTWKSTEIVKNQLPTQLDSVGVTINGKPAYVYYISPSQINVLTPPDALTGSVNIQVTVSGAQSNVFTVPASTVTPSFFVLQGGPYIAATHANGSLLGPTTLYPGASTPAKPGETIVLYGNGFGPTANPVAVGSAIQSGSLAQLPSVTIGGTPAAVQFAGLVSAGLYQFNVVVPANAPDGDLPVQATANGQSTQSGTSIAVQH